MAKPRRERLACEKCGKGPAYRSRTGRILCHACGLAEALAIVRRLEGGGK